ncbi:MerR family transcriptional regulator [Virgisporangium aliadipatigenens]|uniref:MerR family transcriptional regulator n=1 Tax=Virgisporangium aliadipatigenens TaxID=741659 RepID=A0A8J3YWI9_9ACTN|nr:MerR family transcriptional regulator [Virgisporangium aliadipatigenens]GIJ50993.1 MerR family transcriptional regulator [Virgisporangium aliadipatigenens]
MRIGELAELVGVSTRTVRHYHHLGLLPEPTRLPNGYREYRLRDAVTLARVRRLAELGLSLDEIRDVLADDRGRELREVLEELDADLARQQAELGARRARLAVLLAEGELHPDSTVAPELAQVLRGLPAEGSAFGEFDRALLGLIGQEQGEAVAALLEPFTRGEAVERGRDLYARLDRVGQVEDPTLAEDLAAHLRGPLADAMREADPAWMAALSREMSAAQVAVFTRVLQILRERGNA